MSRPGCLSSYVDNLKDKLFNKIIGGAIEELRFPEKKSGFGGRHRVAHIRTKVSGALTQAADEGGLLQSGWG